MDRDVRISGIAISKFRNFAQLNLYQPSLTNSWSAKNRATAKVWSMCNAHEGLLTENGTCHLRIDAPATG
jgi:hypothetical protein